MRQWLAWAAAAALMGAAARGEGTKKVEGPVRLSPSDSMEAILRKAVSVRPSARQLEWQQVEFAAFVHFGMNTFTDREWGEGTEDEKLFSPTALDARQWARALSDAGVRMVILTAKHHDGFCLWPSSCTEHSVKNSPWRGGRGDVVREVADACREAGLKFGFYLSPWDRHEKTYGSPAYNDHFKAQLRELLTGYGPIAEVWFDGANGEGPNGKRQEYDWAGYYALIRELQPQATIAICGPDVRWCGNEAGHNRPSEWSVVPEGSDAQAEDLGGRAQLEAAAKRGAALVWHPSEVDVSIRPGWFYHASEDGKIRSLDNLLDIWYGAVGGNAQLLLNVPPDRRGLIHENDVARLHELGEVLRATFAHNLAARAHPKATDEGVEYDLGAPQTFNRAALQEDIRHGQRVEEFALDAWTGDGWHEFARGTTAGWKRILRFGDVTASRVRLRVTQSRAKPVLASFGLYRAPAVLKAPKIERGADGKVMITAQPGVEVRYWLDGPVRSPADMKYAGPFPLPDGGTVEAIAIAPDDGRYLGDSQAAKAEFPPIAPGAAAVPAASTPAPAQPPASAWQDFHPNLPADAVKRANEYFPLSDQQNREGWAKYMPMWDEFNGKALDPAKWLPINPTWKGRQPAFFSPGNVAVSGGQLHLTMRKEDPPPGLKTEGYHTYSSAAVQSVGTVRYGYFEVRAKAMKSHGSSAFWFYHGLPDWWTEIDVFEIGGGAPEHKRRDYMTVHFFRAPNVQQHWQIGSYWAAPYGLADDYHVYGLEWDENELRYYLDGVLLRKGPNTHWHQPLTMNFDSETMPDWFGLPRDEDLPSVYSVDYVRAWKRRGH